MRFFANAIIFPSKNDRFSIKTSIIVFCDSPIYSPWSSIRRQLHSLLPRTFPWSILERFPFLLIATTLKSWRAHIHTTLGIIQTKQKTHSLTYFPSIARFSCLDTQQLNTIGISHKPVCWRLRVRAANIHTGWEKKKQNWEKSIE